MTEATAQNLSLLQLFVTLGSTVGGSLFSKGTFPKPSVFVGGFFAALFTAVVGEIDADLGGGLAIAIMGTAFVEYGLPALSGQHGKSNALTPAEAAAINNAMQSNIPTQQAFVAVSRQNMTVPAAAAYLRGHGDPTAASVNGRLQDVARNSPYYRK